MADALLDEMAARARGGDRDALEGIVRDLQPPIYNMAVRMLWHPADAEDATQDILIRIITNLASFKGESRFRTWAYRVAANALRTAKGKRRPPAMSFDEFAEDLAEGRALAGSVATPARAEGDRLLEEVKLGCMTGMLLCLDAEHRLAYILGEIFELSGDEAAAVLEISPAAFRKRLSRARDRLHPFLRAICGHANAKAVCRCEMVLPGAIHRGRVRPDALLFADPAKHARRVVALEAARDEAHLYRNHPRYAASEGPEEFLRRLLNDGRLAFLKASN